MDESAFTYDTFSLLIKKKTSKHPLSNFYFLFFYLSYHLQKDGFLFYKNYCIFIFSSHGENIFLLFKMKSHMIEPDVRKGD